MSQVSLSTEGLSREAQDSQVDLAEAQPDIMIMHIPRTPFQESRQDNPSLSPIQGSPMETIGNISSFG
jgi:hypothetical protein